MRSLQPHGMGNLSLRIKQINDLYRVISLSFLSGGISYVVKIKRDIFLPFYNKDNDAIKMQVILTYPCQGKINNLLLWHSLFQSLLPGYTITSVTALIAF